MNREKIDELLKKLEETESLLNREYDRHRLKYLNALQKLNCVYCAYFNGLIAYVREIASRTGQFWCPIRHARRVRNAHRRYWRFLRYGDGKDLEERWMKMREELGE